MPNRGFGAFRPVVVQRAGWYFTPIKTLLFNSRTTALARNLEHGFGSKDPSLVQPAGWYFTPVLVSYVVARRRSLRQNREARPPRFTPTKAVIPTNTVAPVASGVAQNGQTLSTTNGTWTGTTPRTDGSGYQWQTATDLAFTTSISDIGGATASSYLLTGSEVGLYVRCIVKSTNVAAIGTGASNVLGPVAP